MKKCANCGWWISVRGASNPRCCRLFELVQVDDPNMETDCDLWRDREEMEAEMEATETTDEEWERLFNFCYGIETECGIRHKFSTIEEFNEHRNRFSKEAAK